MLGYGGHPDWRDMSEYLVHLTTADALNRILPQRTLEPADSVGAVRKLTELADSQRAACLSEIPLDRLDRLVARHGSYGLGLLKPFVRTRGGAPVWYLYRDSPVALSFQSVVTEAMTGGIEPSDKIWRVTPFIDNPGAGEQWRYEFEWEREWRVVGGLRFEYADLAFLIAPEHGHSQLISWLSQAMGNAPHPPILDLAWDLSRLQSAFADHGLSGLGGMTAQ